MRNQAVLLTLIFVTAYVAHAQYPPAQRIVNLEAPDGTPLAATSFAAMKPRPGVLLRRSPHLSSQLRD